MNIRTYSTRTVFLLLFLGSMPVNAAPTIDGVNAITEGDAQVYTDSNDKNVLWVTPRTTGTLSLKNGNSLFVDKNLCKNAATVNKRKNNYLKRITATEDKYFDALDRQDGGDLAVSDDYLRKLLERKQLFQDQIKTIKYDSEMFYAGGAYSYVASSGLIQTLDAVRSKNATRSVQPIQANVTGIIPSLSNSNDVAMDDIFVEVGIPNLKDLASPVDEIQVDVKITKLGACYISYPEIMSSSAEPFKFGFIVNYEHPFLFAQRVTASYNLKRVYQRIEKTKRKKRFFSSKTYTSVVESTELSSDLKVKVISDQPLGPELKLQLENQAREIVLNVAVTEMVAKMKEAGEVGDSGAQIAAQELGKVCGTNVYCQGAGAALRVLDGIFGGSSQTGSIIQKLDHNVSYDSVTGQTLPVARSISYVSD